MSSWGNNDNAANAPFWSVSTAITHGGSVAAIAAAPDATNTALLYGNTTPSLYVNGQTVGLFMVNATETTAGGDNVVDVAIIQGGTQYAEAPAVSFTSGSGSSAAATAYVSGGVVTNIQVTNVGSGYTTDPTVVVASPSISMVYTDVNTSTDVFTYSGANHYFNTGDAVLPILGAGTRISLDVATFAAAAINTSSNIITLTAHPFVTGDYVIFSNGGGTTPSGVTNGGSYFVQKLGADTIALYDTYAHVIRQDQTPDGLGIVDFTTQGVGTGFTLTATITTDKPYYVIKTGAKTFKIARTYALATAGSPTAIDVTARGTGNDKGFTNQTATLATAIADRGLSQSVGGAEHATHTGWNLKRVGTGGRAGRVTYETLVAQSNIIGDGSDDITLPDA